MLDKLYVKQWNIGYANVSFEDVVQNQSLNHFSFEWLPESLLHQFQADPFIYVNDNGMYEILFEHFDYLKNYGTISRYILDLGKGNHVLQKNIIDTGSHLSYPFIVRNGADTFVIPESSKSKQTLVYKIGDAPPYASFTATLMEQCALLDQTIVEWEGRYWLFATHRGDQSNSHLYIYHAPDVLGPYTPHAGNPVKSTLVGSRPAGAFVKHKGSLYRPAMNCQQYYGKSIIIHRIVKLTENEFVEEPIVELTPPVDSPFSFGLHTINFSEGLMVIDGLRKIWAPFSQIRFFLHKILTFS